MIEGVPLRFDGASVSPDFFDTLGIAAVLGRTPQPGDPMLDPNRKIVLSHDLWMRGFGADPGVIGRGIEIERVPFTVVAVMPAGSDVPARAQFWVTLPPSMSRVQHESNLRFLSVPSWSSGGDPHLERAELKEHRLAVPPNPRRDPALTRRRGGRCPHREKSYQS